MTGLLVPTPCIHLVPHVLCIVTPSSGEHCKKIGRMEGRKEGEKEGKKEEREENKKVTIER